MKRAFEKEDPPPFLLAVETSSSVFSVAVGEGPRILSFVQVEGQGRPCALLTDLIEKATAEAGCRLNDLNGFAVSIGPGSFTGLRVGVMTVKTLAWALKKPVVPVSSLEVIARNFQNSAKPVLLFLDARKGNVYSALFRPNGQGRLARATPDELLSPPEALQRISEPTRVVGDGLKRYAHLLDSREADPAPADRWVPRADRACEIAAARWPSAQVDDIHRLVPQYLYSKESDISGR